MSTIQAMNEYEQYPHVRLVAAQNQVATYFNGPTNNGVGATLTYATGALTIDSVAVNLNDFILLAGQTSAYQNGIYQCIQAGATGVAAILQRRGDFQCREQIRGGRYIPVSAGTQYAGSMWVVVEPLPAAIGQPASGTANNIVFALTAASGLNYANVPMTLAQFTGMYAAPFLILAAPGAGNIIQFTRGLIYQTYGSAQLTAGGAVAFQYGNTVHGGGPLASNSEQATDFTGATANQNYWFEGASGNASNMADQSNVGLYLSNATAAFATGTGSTFNVHVWYSIVATP